MVLCLIFRESGNIDPQVGANAQYNFPFLRSLAEGTLSVGTLSVGTANLPTPV